MPAPVLDLRPAWGYKRSVLLPVSTKVMGDNYTSIVSTGARRFDEMYSVRIPSRRTDQIEGAAQLLRNLRGVGPVSWSPSGTDRQEFYIDALVVQPSGVGLSRMEFELKRWAVPMPTAIVPPVGVPEINLVLNWETAFEDQMVVRQSRLGQGVDRRSAFQANSTTRAFEVRVVVNNEEAMNSFLLGLYGRPFRLPAVSRPIEFLNGLFHCTEWTFERLGPYHSRFQSVFKEVVRAQT